METTRSGMSGGTLLAILLTVLFVGLKLGGIITWSWVWVLSPLWISFVLGIVAIIIFLIVALIIAVVSKK